MLRLSFGPRWSWWAEMIHIIRGSALVLCLSRVSARGFPARTSSATCSVSAVNASSLCYVLLPRVEFE